MSNGSQNCALEICCPAAANGDASDKAVTALAHDLATGGVPDEYCDKAARVTLKKYELAERGTLKPFKESIAKLARENP
jgi:hypothetical protein